MNDERTATTGRFDTGKIAASLPGSATTLLVDRYLTDRAAASARVFRVYRPTPPQVFLSIETPRRDPKDVIFVDPADGTPESFIKESRAPL